MARNESIDNLNLPPGGQKTATAKISSDRSKKGYGIPVFIFLLLSVTIGTAGYVRSWDKDISFLAAMLIFGVGLSVVLLWRSQRSEFQKKQYQAEIERLTLVQHFGYLTQYVNDIVFLMDQDLNIVEVNDRAVELFGYTRDELLRMNIRDVRSPEHRSTLDDHIREVEKRKGFVYETTCQRKDGSTFPVEVSSRLVEVEGRRFYQGIARDITEHKKADEKIARLSRVYSVLSDINQAIVRVRDKQKLLEEACRIAVEKGLLRMAWIGLVEPDGSCLKPVAHAGIEEGYLKRVIAPVAETLIPEGRGLIGTAILEGRNVICNDIEHDPQIAPWRAEALKRGYLAVAVFPIRVGSRIVGAFNLYAPEPHFFDEQEVQLLNGLVGDLSFAVESIEGERWRRNAEEELRKSEELFRELYDGAPVGYHEIDTEGRVVHVNRADLEMLGYTADEVLGKYIWEFNVEENLAREGVLEKLAGKRRPGHPFERAYRRKNGTTIPVLLQDRYVFDEEGRISGLRVTIQDISERKRMEETLRESEKRYKELFDNAPVGYHEYDAEGRIININRTGLEMLGYAEEEMLGQFVWKTNADEEGSRKRILARLAGIRPPEHGLQSTFRRKDGSTFPVLIDNRLIRDEKGRIKGVRSIVQDITERERAGEELVQLQEQLRQSQKLEAIGQLAGGIAHDFNNLLTVIKGYSQISLMELRDHDPLKGNIEEIQEATDRASALTRQLLAFSRRQVMEMKVQDLNDLVRDLDKMLRRIIGEDIELATLLADDLGRVKVDPGQIEQVIVNLAINARDAMPHGGRLTIETGNADLGEEYAQRHIGVKPGRYVLISVNDNGVGIAPEIRERIFEPFFTTKEKGKGTGLGLSVVYGIVKQSGGEIWVYSEVGQGTSFKIYLPRVEEPLEKARGRANKIEALPAGTETVLVVEDEEEVRKLTVLVLKRQGYKILEAAQGGGALLICEKHDGPIHLMVTDVVMPGMSGHDLAKRVESLHPEMKVLYMSGYTDDAIVHHGVLEPGTNFIQKPFTPDSLARKVREVLDQEK